MAYTQHGHHIAGSSLSENKPGAAPRCVGPQFCRKCFIDTRAWQLENDKLKGINVNTKPPSPILRYFSYRHLPAPLASVSHPFCLLAHEMEDTLPAGQEKSVCLRKLLEAKDAAVRAALDISGVTERTPD